MRLKEIKPGMAIHCKNDEEKKALLEEAERLGYRWSGGYKISEYEKHRTGYTIHFYGPSICTNYNHIRWSDDTDGVTEFSDLILPELTEKEAIEWMAKHLFDEEFKKVFGFDYLMEGALSAMTSEEMIKRIAKWKSNHEKKEPEVEWVYRVFGAENFAVKFFRTEEEAIKRCEELAKSQKTKQYARYERICRVKAVE